MVPFDLNHATDFRRERAAELAPGLASSIAEAVFTSRLGQWLTSTRAARKPAWLVRALLRGEPTLAPLDIAAEAAHVPRTTARPISKETN